MNFREAVMRSEGTWDALFETDPEGETLRAGRIASGRLDEAQLAFWTGDYRRAAHALRGRPTTVAETARAVRLYRRMGLDKEAVGCLTSAIRARPGFAPWRLARAVIHEELRGYGAALRDYEAAARLDPWSMRARVLGVCRLKMWAGRTREAARDVAPLARKVPDFPGALRMAGALLVLRGRFAQGASALARAIRLSPSDGEAFLWRAEALRRLGRREEAAECATASRRCGGSDLIAGVNLALLGFGGTGLDYVRAHLPPALRVPARRLSSRLAGPGSRRSAHPPPAPRVWLNEILRALKGNRSSALTCARGGRLIACPDIHPRQEMVDLQKRLLFAPPAAVLKEFAARIKSSAGLKRARWRVHRGEVLLWLGDYRRAAADIGAGLSHPVFRWPLVGAAGAAMLLGDAADALARIETAVRAGAPEPVWRPWRGEILRRLGRLEESLADLELASARPSFTPSTWVNLALTCGALGQEDRRRELFGVLSQRCPSFMAEAGSLERALVMMRGNRSNRIFTYFTSGGEFRILTVEPPPRRRSC